MSLAGKTINGLKWSYVFTVLNVVFQLALTIVLARLLSPNDYGLVAMGNVVLRFGSYFAQMGIGQSLIQRNKIDRQSVFTAYFLALFLSLFFYLIIFFLAPLSQYLFSNPQIITIIRILAINLVFSSIATISTSLLRINYKYRLLGTIDFIAFIIGNGVVAILMALCGYGVWSLVVSVLIQGVIQFSLAFYFTREYYGYENVNYDAAKKLLSYGGRYTISTFIEVITYSADYLMIGHYFKERFVGIYNRASLLVQLPSQYISANLIKVLFPTLNELKNDRERFIKYYQSVNFLLGFVLFGVCVFVSLNANEIVYVLLGEKWKEASPVLRIIAMAVPFNLLINYNGLIYDVYGILNQKIVVKIFHMLVMILSFYLFKSHGLLGIAYAFLITEMIFYIVYTYISHRKLNIALNAIIKSNLPFLYIIINVSLISYLLGLGCEYLGLSNVGRLIVEMTGTPSLFLILLFIYTPKMVKAPVIDVLPTAVINNNKYFNYLMKFKPFRNYWNINWGTTGFKYY